MDEAWGLRLLEALGDRYKLGSKTEDGGVELRYRFGKAEFRPTRLVVGAGPDHRTMSYTIDVRVPKDTPGAEADALIESLEAQTMRKRGFERTSMTETAMTSEAGEARGSVRTLIYSQDLDDTALVAKTVRALVESLENPLIVGLHTESDLLAKDPPPPPPKPKTAADEELEVWKYRLEDGLLGSLILEVDPNERTLRVVERKLVSTKQIGDELKLQTVEKLGVRKTGSGVDLVAVKRDGEETKIVSGSGDRAFLETVERLGEKVFLPVVQLT